MNRDRVLKDRGWKNLEELPKGANGRPLCRWCKKETLQSSQAFCSDSCFHEFRIRSSTNYAREQVFNRDRGVCSKCGLDTEKLRETLYAIRLIDEDAYRSLVQSYRKRYGYGFNLSDHFFEMDHTIPVHLGGGSCGISNLATLCVPCHRSKTREEMRRKRLRRKGITAQWKK